MIVLIPAFRPDTRLARLVLDLHRADPSIQTLVVDDGSGPDYAVYFDAARAAGAELVSHVANRGKGAALRTGIARAAELRPGEPVVTADADGQHLVEDILAVGRECDKSGEIVLGVRSFDGDVPFRSKFGNDATAFAFRLATGVRLPDTQTGLRACPSSSIRFGRSTRRAMPRRTSALFGTRRASTPPS
ncbi:glycosyltransferase family 2 protein [Schaalia hyovaginalis]|uniref:glycosyltransferase family 2 protein n=1 Tax=Schaalia hyovaginalis TaxID=29316 RepID=UPI0026EA5354|nr:glycosyltransferase family 2 protein [Schaalia hyovaginalis]MCI6557392.1 glycosyltransferase family 2 protein [Schaalia hyovaginalis]MDD7554114.1 glycosyltransferase family 2 protein [Schaalia hyovaginalis]MDY3094037.1 glycosyltransferase family 2 protein [Schaalia hyovaginalis]